MQSFPEPDGQGDSYKYILCYQDHGIKSCALEALRNKRKGFRVQHVVHGWCTHVRTSGDVLTRPKQKAHLYVSRLRLSSLIGR